MSCVLICIPFPPQPPMAETGGRAGAVEAVAAQAVEEEGPMTMDALMQAAEAVEAEAAVVPYYERLVARLSEDWVEGDDRMEVFYVDVGYKSKAPVVRLGEEHFLILSHAQAVLEDLRGVTGNKTRDLLRQQASESFWVRPKPNRKDVLCRWMVTVYNHKTNTETLGGIHSNTIAKPLPGALVEAVPDAWRRLSKLSLFLRPEEPREYQQSVVVVRLVPAAAVAEQEEGDVEEWYIDQTLTLMTGLETMTYDAQDRFRKVFYEYRDAIAFYTGKHEATLTQGLEVKTGGLCRKGLARMHTITGQMKALLDAFSHPMDLEKQQAYSYWVQGNCVTKGAKLESKLAPSCEFRRFLFFVFECMMTLSVAEAGGSEDALSVGGGICGKLEVVSFALSRAVPTWLRVYFVASNDVDLNKYATIQAKAAQLRSFYSKTVAYWVERIGGARAAELEATRLEVLRVLEDQYKYDICNMRV